MKQKRRKLNNFAEKQYIYNKLIKMDKNIIKQYLSERFLAEVTGDSSTPGITVTNAANKKSGKINKDGVNAIEKDVKQYDKDLKKNKSEVTNNKFNYENDWEKTYHNDMEIMNGQEMIQYTSEPSKLFKEKAKEAIEGSTRMGNKGGKGRGNAEESWDASSDDFGKDFVKRVNATTKKRADATDKLISFGDDIENTKSKPKNNTKFSALNEGALGKGYTHFAINKNDGKIYDGWDYTGEDKESVAYYAKIDLKDNFPNNKPSDFKVVTKNLLAKQGMNVSDTNNWYKPESASINNNNPQIKESMKRLKFKKEFNGVGNALKMIPESYRVDNKEFEMTDGNESYKIRWEGTLTEGRAVVLTAANKTMINEDMQKMKHLMGYKSQDTLGTSKTVSRLTEGAIFDDILAKTRVLLEGEDIESVDAPEKDAEGDDVINQAPEAKKHIEGSVSTDDGTDVPAPKEGHWEDISVPQAADAKKHIEGSVATEAKTNAPAPKEGHWEDIKKPQAPEAKKDITMNESEEEEVPVNNEDPKSQPGYVHEDEVEDEEEEEEMVDESIKLMVSESTGKFYIVGATDKPFAVPAKDNAKALKNPKKYISEVFKK